MKKIHLLLLGLTICLFTACHDKLWDAIDDLDVRVARLEELCKEMNTNIVSIQTIVNVVQSGDYITGITEIKKDGEVIGYTITFAQHDPITIYNGEDGSATAPIIGVTQDTDGVYYWTLNGEWLLDDNGNKLPVSGKDGQNGANGTMPQLKIEEGYWYVSYDNGVTWTQLGKATGEDGKKGDKGDAGDSMFQSVTQDENFVYFTLADGTVIKIAKGNGNSQSNDDFIFTITYDPNGGEGVMKVDTFYYGQIKNLSPCTFNKDHHKFVNWNTKADGNGFTYTNGEPLVINKNITLHAKWIHESLCAFSTSENNQVVFSSGNLQHNPSTKAWRFAPCQLDYIGEDNKNISQTYNGWLDLFAWDTPYGKTENFTGYYTPKFHEYGQHTIGNEKPNTWRTLTISEWNYILNQRTNADNLKGIAQINGINCIILLPDRWSCPEGITFKSGETGSLAYAQHQTFIQNQWLILEQSGAIALPQAGYREGTVVHKEKCCYWSVEDDYADDQRPPCLEGLRMSDNYAYLYGFSIRLVKDL